MWNAIFSAFYDGGRTSAQAGDFVFKTVVPALKSACPGKKVYITEYVPPAHQSPLLVSKPNLTEP